MKTSLWHTHLQVSTPCLVILSHSVSAEKKKHNSALWCRPSDVYVTSDLLDISVTLHTLKLNPNIFLLNMTRLWRSLRGWCHIKGAVELHYGRCRTECICIVKNKMEGKASKCQAATFISSDPHQKRSKFSLLTSYLLCKQGKNDWRWRLICAVFTFIQKKFCTQ